MRNRSTAPASSRRRTSRSNNDSLAHGSTRLSAALIVRDESRFIEPCLRSLAGIVDEIVVVDTGSTDDTIEKARRFPIELHEFAWGDDFSAARNFAIEQARADWILYIDADERLEVPDLAALRQALADESKAGWRLRFFPRVGWTPYAELRLFRNDPRIRFKGVIHENMQDGVDEVCRSDGLTIGTCDVALHHVGYEGGQRHKIARNVPLLCAYLAEDPTRVYCWWHLGEMLLFAGDEEGAAEAWRSGIEVARKQGATPPTMNGMPYYSLLLLQHSRGTAIDALLEEAVRMFPDHLALRWLHCKHALERGGGESVRSELEALAAIDPDKFSDPRLSYDKKLFSYAARESLALCHFRAGRFRDAADWYRRAAPTSPDPRACEVKAQLADAKAAPRAV
jgi:tetratricopeptide (TPR) repeat protein